MSLIDPTSYSRLISLRGPPRPCHVNTPVRCRRAELFRHILCFYRTGKIHFPKSECVAAFLEELSYFGIQVEAMQVRRPIVVYLYVNTVLYCTVLQ